MILYHGVSRAIPLTTILARPGWESELCRKLFPDVPIIHEGCSILDRIGTLIRTYPPNSSAWERLVLSTRFTIHSESILIVLSHIVVSNHDVPTRDIPLIEDDD